MTDFGSWHWVELKISIGEITIAAVTALSAYWVASVLASQQENAKSVKELIGSLCRDALDHLASVSRLVDEECAGGNTKIENNASRIKFMRHFQRLSNSLHAIETAANDATMRVSLTEAKTAADELERDIVDRLVANSALDVRQIEGAVLRVRESIIRFVIACHKGK